MDQQKLLQRKAFEESLEKILAQIQLGEEEKLLILDAWDKSKEGTTNFESKTFYNNYLFRILALYLFHRGFNSVMLKDEFAKILQARLSSMWSQPGETLKDYLKENEIEGISLNDFREFLKRLTVYPAQFYAILGIE